MRILYHLIRQYLYEPGIGRYIGYGIRGLSNEKHGWVCKAEVQDVSVNAEYVESLAALYTKMELDPIHLHDAVEDALNA